MEIKKRSRDFFVSYSGKEIFIIADHFHIGNYSSTGSPELFLYLNGEVVGHFCSYSYFYAEELDEFVGRYPVVSAHYDDLPAEFGVVK